MQFRLFFRLIKRNTEIFGLKVLTLAIAFACSVLVILFSIHEFTYDEFHPDAKSIFRILLRHEGETFNGNRYSNRIADSAYIKLAHSLDGQLIFSRVRVLDRMDIVSLQSHWSGQRVHATDGTFPDILSFTIIHGSLKEFKSADRTILLSSSRALLYFKTVEAAGKILKISSGRDTLECRISAVFEDTPPNTHERFDFIVHFDNAHLRQLDFDMRSSAVYGRLVGENLSASETRMNALLKTKDIAYSLQPLPDIYLGRRVAGENVKHGDGYSISILLGITGLILFLAVTTYINLTTLTLPDRAKELAMRKVAGASNTHLLFIFIRESFFLTAAAFAIALALILSGSLIVKRILEIDFQILIRQSFFILLLAMTCIFVVVMLAPVLVVLKFTAANPNRLLSTETLTFPKFKRTISFLQLGVSLFLIVSSLIIKRQINYSLIKEPGQNHYQVVVVPFGDLTDDQFYELKVNWKRLNPNIIDVLALSHLPDNLFGKELGSGFYYLKTDPGFISFFGLNMVHGKWLKTNDSSAVVLNEKGFEKRKRGDPLPAGTIENFGSIFNQPEIPLKIKIGELSEYNFLCIRVLEVDIRKTVDRLSRSFGPVSFMDSGFLQWLSYENKLNKFSEMLAVVSALLSCCAIYGLSVSLARDKAKQIAIHKISGATTTHVIFILIHQFIKPVVSALLFFGPLAFLFITDWLRKFAYATSLNVTDLLIALSYCFGIVFITCGYQALKLDRVSLSTFLRG